MKAGRAPGFDAKQLAQHPTGDQPAITTWGNPAGTDGGKLALRLQWLIVRHKLAPTKSVRADFDRQILKILAGLVSRDAKMFQEIGELLAAQNAYATTHEPRAPGRELVAPFIEYCRGNWEPSDPSVLAGLQPYAVRRPFEPSVRDVEHYLCSALPQDEADAISSKSVGRWTRDAGVRPRKKK